MHSALSSGLMKKVTASSRSRMRERDLLLFVLDKKEQMLRRTRMTVPFSSALPAVKKW